MLRTVKRWFTTDEVKLLGTELDVLRERFSDLGHKLEGVELKHDRLTNKLRMQSARADRHPRGNGELSEEEEAIIDRLRAQDPGATRGDPFSGGI